jgi:hypothetical protein
MPPKLDSIGSFFSAGEVVSRGGPVTVTIRSAGQPLLASDRQRDRVARLAATRVDVPLRMEPLRHSCGRYVDWYELD